jgi:hypothetical protein
MERPVSMGKSGNVTGIHLVSCVFHLSKASYGILASIYMSAQVQHTW